MSAPIVFCHFGNTAYLQYTLTCARTSNPGKSVVLLGDDLNRGIAKRCGVSHVRFDDFARGSEIETFDSVYRLVQGGEHRHLRGGRDWVNFVFKRWFYVHNFLAARGIESFWHFDSDNMIVCDLEPHEARLAAYDCTEQCNGQCMNGFISGRETVRRYLDKINELFQRSDFLATQQHEFDTVRKNYAFTEMRAYAELVRDEPIRRLRLNAIADGSSFDDCICQPHGMEMEELAPGKMIKKVFLKAGGGFFCRSSRDDSLIRMNSLNLSWVPLYLFANVLNHARGRVGATGDAVTLGSLKRPTGAVVAEAIARGKAGIVRLLAARGGGW